MISKIIALMFSQMEEVRSVAQYNQYRRAYNIHPTVKFNGPGILFYGNGKIKIGQNSYIGRYSSIQTSEGCAVNVGSNTAISHYVMIYTENRCSSQNFSKVFKTRKADVNIGSYCWIGAFTFICEGTSIGDNVVIGAHSVVTKDVPSFTVVAGVPARVIKKIPT